MAQMDKTYGLIGLLNFRDIAVSVNQKSVRDSRLTEGKIYRGARPDFIPLTDREILQGKLHISTILDLRSKTEHIEAAKKFSAVNHGNSATIKIPGIKYSEINLNGKGFERHLVWQLSYTDLSCLIAYMLFGYRLQGISIIGKKVLQPRGLIGLGKDTLKHSAPEIKQIFDILSSKESYPILIHCTQGKDRTGLVVALVLLLCSVDINTITQDYVQSEKELEPELEERLTEIASIGLDESFARCPVDFIKEITSFIDAEYGGVRQYLNKIHVNNDQIDFIKRQLLQ